MCIRDRDSGVLFSASASYKIAPTTFAYARYAGGFRPGVGRVLPGPICGPDFAALGIDPATIPPFTRPEKLDSYEAGLRQSSRDGRFSASLTGFIIKSVSYTHLDVYKRQILFLQQSSTEIEKPIKLLPK